VFASLIVKHYDERHYRPVYFKRSEVFTAVKMSVLLFWVVTPRRLADTTLKKHPVSAFRAKGGVKC
jgi:hypothetical protein